MGVSLIDVKGVAYDYDYGSRERVTLHVKLPTELTWMGVTMKCFYHLPFAVIMKPGIRMNVLSSILLLTLSGIILHE